MTVLEQEGHVYFEQSDVIMFCRKMYVQELKKSVLPILTISKMV